MVSKTDIGWRAREDASPKGMNCEIQWGLKVLQIVSKTDIERRARKDAGHKVMDCKILYQLDRDEPLKTLMHSFKRSFDNLSNF